MLLRNEIQNSDSALGKIKFKTDGALVREVLICLPLGVGHVLDGLALRGVARKVSQMREKLLRGLGKGVQHVREDVQQAHLACTNVVTPHVYRRLPKLVQEQAI